MSLLSRWFGPPSQDQFAQLMVKTLAAGGVEGPVEYRREQFLLELPLPGRSPTIINLHNIYQEYCQADRASRALVLQRTCQGLMQRMELPTDFEDAKPDLLPTLRDRFFAETVRLQSEAAGSDPTELITVPVTDECIIALVYDLPNSMRFVGKEALDTWGISVYEALEVAKQNLAELSYPVLSVGDKVFVIESGDAYDATRMLLTDNLRQLPVLGAPVVMPINRNCLLITGADDEEGLGIVAKLAELKQQDARPLLPMLFRLVGEEYQKWLPPAGHSHRAKFRELELLDLQGTYAQQKELLDQRNEQLGRDEFVATYTLLQRGEEMFSYCVWARGVVASLPKTDYVALMDPAKEPPGLTPWDELQRVAGTLLQPLDCYPPRLRVESFPTAEQLAQMETVPLGD